MRRREFITLFGGATAAWPLVASALPGGEVRRIAVLMGWSESNPQFRSLVDEFIQELSRLGWADGRNVQIDVRWTDGDVGRTQTFAKELVDLRPDVILASTTPVTAALQRETRNIPIVFGRRQGGVRPSPAQSIFHSPRSEIEKWWPIIKASRSGGLGAL